VARATSHINDHSSILVRGVETVDQPVLRRIEGRVRPGWPPGEISLHEIVEVIAPGSKFFLRYMVEHVQLGLMRELVGIFEWGCRYGVASLLEVLMGMDANRVYD
jgi:hypothetical protein